MRESRRGKKKEARERKSVHREEKNVPSPVVCILFSSVAYSTNTVTHYFIYSFLSILFYVVFVSISVLVF